MKWVWISTGIALIVAITVICCYMIYEDRYTCDSFVWALYLLLVAQFIFCGYLMIKKVKGNAAEKTMLQQQTENETKQNLFATEMTKDIIDLRNKLSKMQEDMKEYNELRNIVMP